MSKQVFLWSIFIVLIFVCLLGMRSEGFGDYTSYDRSQYIQTSKQKYNPLSETTDVQYTNHFLDTNDNPRIASALQTSDIDVSQTANTLLGVRPALSRAIVGTPPGLQLAANKCETLRSRVSCAKLDDPAYTNCGICIKGGTATSVTSSKNYIGGLLLLPKDKQTAKDLVAGTNSPPLYIPSNGECPNGYFFADRPECEKQVNRLDCAEAGLNGGFSNGKTIEGKNVIGEKCANVLNSGNHTFIYEPKSRTFNVNLRVLAPIGTGNCQVVVYNAQKKQVGQGFSNTPGIEFVVTVFNVKENDRLAVTVYLEAPYRYGTNRELYQIKLQNKVSSATEAGSVCNRYGSTQATLADLQKAVSQFPNGSHVCNPGWTADGVLAWPSQISNPVCGVKGVNQSSERQGDIWCYGLRPPQSDNMIDMVKIANWDEKNISAFGPTNTTPFKRAVLLQWEMVSGHSNRFVGFESTITHVQGVGPSSVVGGVNIFSNLKTFGQYANASNIYYPVFNSDSKMAGTRVWLWTTNQLNQQAVFNVTVPGIFMDSFYAEDLETSAYGPLIGDPAIAAKLQSSPCLQKNQTAGLYDLSCLQSAFLAAGGDINKGLLVLQNGGLTQLNTLGSLNAISNYLDNQYSIATTGKDMSGNLVGTSFDDTRTKINSASLNLFGITLASPCEIITQDVNGNIVIVPKKNGEIDEWCLDYLWTNTGSELENGQGDDGKSIQHTYTSIGQRFSGLRSNERSAAMRQQSPFTLCQRTGYAAPIKADGKANTPAIDHVKSLGNITDIQRYYNSIFNAANSRTFGPEQKNAVQMCYGIFPKQS